MSVNEKMTALADEVRALSGITDVMSIDAMTTNVSDANTEVNTQVDLITQIQTALEGKASGGGSAIKIQVNNQSTQPVYYAGVDKQTYTITAGQSITVEALGGTLAFRQEYATQATGDYIHLVSFGGVMTYIFCADGGSITMQANAGSDD
jgi:hypothetical protein